MGLLNCFINVYSASSVDFDGQMLVDIIYRHQDLVCHSNTFFLLQLLLESRKLGRLIGHLSGSSQLISWADRTIRRLARQAIL
jgi:hypothetical protein